MESDDFFLFVSHVTEDRAAASQVVEELERRGVRCWIAPRNVQPGKPFDDDIADAIESCRAMLLIFSSQCNENDYIRREITVAGNANKLIIPFRIEDVEPKRGLSVRLANLHWIDAFVARERAIDEVVRSVPPSSADKPQASRPVASDEARVRWTPPKPQPTSTIKLVTLPWTPIETLQQARELTVLGASCFALVAFGIGVRAGNGQELLLAALFGGCAVGTYFDWRLASPIGLVLILVVVAMLFADASRGAVAAPVVLIVLLIALLLALAAIASMRGTLATARLLSASEGHRQGGTA
jgi:TIR domain-containing protein